MPEARVHSPALPLSSCVMSGKLADPSELWSPSLYAEVKNTGSQSPCRARCNRKTCKVLGVQPACKKGWL